MILTTSQLLTTGVDAPTCKNVVLARVIGSMGEFDRYGPEARQVLDELLEKYAEHGDAQFVLPDALHVPPISTHGQPGEIIRLFGGPDQLRKAVQDLQNLLYSA